jgi:hypothetical protein
MLARELAACACAEFCRRRAARFSTFPYRSTLMPLRRWAVSFLREAASYGTMTMKRTTLQAVDGFQDASVAEMSAVEGGGKIAYNLGLIGIAIGNALGGEAGGGVGWKLGNAVGKAIESVVNVVT